MRLRVDPPLDLTYCTNIHPADGWEATRASIAQIAPAVKARVSPAAPFGLGLRLGARDARELLHGAELERFRDFLGEHGLYVSLINGFPYGPFHGEPVKTDVYAPDWRTDARVEYTLNLIEILHALAPEGTDAGISTSPLSYKPWLPSPTPHDWEHLTTNVLRVAERLIRLKLDTGRVIHLDIEPEPDCTLETTSETVTFFEQWLWRAGAAVLAGRLGIRTSAVVDYLRAHIQVCFDCCHCAVEYEEPAAAIGRLRGAGIRIGRVQLSSAVDVDFSGGADRGAATLGHLRAFVESTYLHQVVERQHGQPLRRFRDLDVALEEADRAQDQTWRIHFHVPLFAAEYDGLGSTQDVVLDVLRQAASGDVTPHLEIETYTWNVLPAGLKMDLTESIAREYGWVLSACKQLGLEVIR